MGWALNVFVLDPDPRIAASYLCDKHVVKMALETAQILSTVSWMQGRPAPYKPTHKGHPCVKWAAQAHGNWAWLKEHGIGISLEYTKRYGKQHASQKVIEEVTADLPLGRTDFVQAMPVQYHRACAVSAYREYYLGEKRGIATWKGQPPFWWVL